jgi:hypothetical protein
MAARTAFDALTEPVAVVPGGPPGPPDVFDEGIGGQSGSPSRPAGRRGAYSTFHPLPSFWERSQNEGIARYCSKESR